MRLPPTQSGRAMLVELSDDEALGLCPGAVVVVRSRRPVMHEYDPLHVDHVRLGVAYDDATPPHASTVPVIEGYRGLTPQAGERPLVYAVPDCLGPRWADVGEEATTQDEAA